MGTIPRQESVSKRFNVLSGTFKMELLTCLIFLRKGPLRTGQPSELTRRVSSKNVDIYLCFFCV
jgi:hypothetical protein